MSATVLRALPYHRDTALLLALMADCPGLVCLDSGLEDRNDARYDVISSWPSMQWRSERDSQLAPYLSQRPAGQSQWEPLANQQQTLLQYLEAWQTSHRPASAVLQQLSFLPFCGGLIGYLGYHTTQSIREGLNPEHYRPTDDPARIALNTIADAEVGLYEWGIVVDHQRAQCWLFILPECPVAIRREVILLEQRILAAARQVETANQSGASASLDASASADADAGAIVTASASAEMQSSGLGLEESAFRLEGSYQALTSSEQYAAAFADIQRWIHAGDCYQVNLAIPFTARYRGDPLYAYHDLRQRSKSPFSAFLRLDHGALLSVSPERFISVRSRHVTAQPIKGTRPRSSDPQTDARMRADLLASEKDKAENLMIVDLLRNDLGKICETGSIQTPRLFDLQSFSQVHHLVSTVTGTLASQTSALRLLESAFPGGSITGAPKSRAMQIIGVLEPVQRSIYCGSIFYHDFNGNLDSNICIRTLLCSDSHIFCWAGSGIVADSRWEEEYRECHDKVSALIR